MNDFEETLQKQHRRVKDTLFYKRIEESNITDYQYYVYLVNQFMCFYILESYAEQKDLFNGVYELKRSLKISKDLAWFERVEGFVQPPILKSTSNYMSYVERISREPKRLLSHICARHTMSSSAGQTIKNLWPFAAQYYEFDYDEDELKNKIRIKVDNSMLKELCVCFKFMCSSLEELELTVSNSAP